MNHGRTLLILLASLPASICWAGEKIHVGTPISTPSQVSMNQVDHSLWDTLLKKYVDADGNVDYKRWKASPDDGKALSHYLGLLSTASPSKKATHEAKLAFWINAYNAVTVHGILREYPTSTIRNHTAKLYGYNIWHDLLLTVGKSNYSLDTIEHKILRKMDEPRIHFAIVCASKGCPRLLNEAYLPEKLSQQLQRNTLDFFSRNQNFRYDPVKERMYLSAILTWFAEDFGKTKADQLNWIAPYLSTKQSQSAARSGSTSVSYLDYNWSLNEQQ